MKYFIITYTGVHHEITEEQNEVLKGLGINDEIEINGNMVKTKNISDILTSEKYFETYPKKKPVAENRLKYLTGLGYEGFIEHSRKDILERMIIGLKKYLSSDLQNPIKMKEGTPVFYQGTDAPKEILASMEKRLLELN